MNELKINLIRSYIYQNIMKLTYSSHIKISIILSKYLLIIKPLKFIFELSQVFDFWISID